MSTPADAFAADLEDWDDASLVGRSAGGDDQAFAVLVRRYQAPLYRHAWRLTQDRRTAEDVTQEAFLTAWRRLPSLVRPESFRSWLYQIATRRSIDVVRARRPEQPLDRPGTGDTVGLGDTLVSADPGPAAAAEHHEQLEDLAAALQALPLSQRAAWSMREIDGLSYDEIAVALVLPVSTVRGRIARARHELAERMSAWQTTRD
ncbi:MAG TPA: sigma-70 family RNA polymerase sigma factor [Friedmanniella sp.]